MLDGSSVQPSSVVTAKLDTITGAAELLVICTSVGVVTLPCWSTYIKTLVGTVTLITVGSVVKIALAEVVPGFVATVSASTAKGGVHSADKTTLAISFLSLIINILPPYTSIFGVCVIG
ncbi:hypothetical protein [Clostridium beijerinckii]|uniref:hypothetical protein n=1 Tax=Clostridium beijerinckii TaxID=1520 RepID=UPI001A9B733F|nr:hypothetical protein [Clostridium beijerinckii]MBC2457157.1 hypothetical protein [Clostridium beijerinckii]